MQNSASTQAERVLIDWLRTWKGPGDPHGVAMVNCSLFFEKQLHQFDAIVWTPTSCVVIEAEALVEHVSGELEVPLDGPWRVGSQVVSLEGGRRNPLDSSRAHTYALQGWLADRGLGQRVVQGVVLVVPPRGSSVRLRQLWSDPGLQVVVGDRHQHLAEYLDALTSMGRAQWTTNEVAMAFRGLNLLPYLPSPQDLVAEGFGGPVDTTLWRGGPQQAQAESFREEMTQLEQDAARPTSMAMPWYSPWELYPTEPGEMDLRQGAKRIVLAVGMLVAVAWLLWFVITAIVQFGPG
ncbi:nuclease-related domain-containing protein [Nocardia miyunensis]|uniref:nuclease-related domain-containing protein n=1 Tax=Nocardia miyunensis TaxID=282684 RepID=UPI001FDF811F|nr:nuclease-related domain-containing protein [Nocardia miyunensis]